MSLIADILLASGALGAGFYCVVLSRRLSRFTDLEKGVGGAIATLSGQVDDMTKALAQARRATATSADSLSGMTQKAANVAQRLELLVASMHDIPTGEEDEAIGPRTNADVADAVTFQSRRAQYQEAAE